MSRKILIIVLVSIVVIVPLIFWTCTPSLQESPSPAVVVDEASSTSAVLADRLSISEPAEGSSVLQKDWVRGAVSDPTAQVWVMVHPPKTDGYWLQPKTTVHDDGTWEGEVYFGRPGRDVGAELEVRAFMDPLEGLKAGKSQKWLKAKARSEIVTVIRE